ncbi:MAG: hypothetical protein K8R92_09055 [Planctomycetes bacterium]|nr:hypothetical protein [Planctomycetota bacterium]
MTADRSLEEQRQEFGRRRNIAMPIAGAIAWTAVGVAGMFLNTMLSAWVLFGATGMIAYLGIFISRFTGENFLDKTRPKNAFDRLFFYGVAQALLVYSIAIPFFLVDHTSLPLTVGILSGLMWIPLSWIIQHWIGLFHSFVRTGLIVAAWYLWPAHRFTAIPIVIVAVYLVTLVVLEARWRRLA